VYVHFILGLLGKESKAWSLSNLNLMVASKFITAVTTAGFLACSLSLPTAFLRSFIN